MPRNRLSLSLLAAVLAVSLLGSPTLSLAVSRTDAVSARQRAEAAKKRQAEQEAAADKLLSETNRLEARISHTRGELTRIQGRVTEAEARRSKLETEIAGLRQDVAAKQSEIASTQAAYVSQQDALDRRVNNAYREGDLFYLEMLLEARSFSDLLARTYFVQRVMAQDQEIMRALSSTRTTLQHAKTDMDRSLATLSLKRQEIASEQAQLRHLRSDQRRQLADQRSAQDEKETMLAETKADIARLKAIVAAEEKEARRIERLLSGGGSSQGSGKYAGTMSWPTPGYTRITSKFGYRMHPVLHERRFHAGIDIGAPEGARIVAAASGTVISAGYNNGYGNMTMIDHGDGLVTVYGHQSSIGVSVGQHVSKGQKIGEVGSTGMSTGPHLHFEVRVNGEAHDPFDYL